MTDQPLSNSPAEELAKVTKEIYERNVELAISNRTLSLLRKMYEIMSSSLNTSETSQRLADAIVKDLNFQKGMISLVDKSGDNLETIAVSPQEPRDSQLEKLLGKPFKQFSVSLKELENFCVKAFTEKKTRLTNNLYDVFIGAVDEKISLKIQEILHIQTTIIYPITFGKETLGVLSLGIDKHIGSLSRAELESMHELVEVVGIALERVRIYNDLQVANEKLKELDRQKDEFLSVAAHELRAPMTAIKGYLSMVVEGDGGSLTPQTKDFIGETITANERLIRLVNNLLNISRIEKGRLVYRMGDINLSQVAKTVSNEFQVIAQEKKLLLNLVVSDNIKDLVYVDQDRIHEVVANLISNAIKYTDIGKITIHLSNPDEHHIKLEVIDSGHGISPEEQEKLFQKFYRTGSSIGKAMGTGLGLYISKLLVEKFGGKIGFSSEVGKGSNFYFELQLK